MLIVLNKPRLPATQQHLSAVFPSRLREVWMCVRSQGSGLHISTAALFITLMRRGHRVRSAQVSRRTGAQLVSPKWDVISGRVAFIKLYVLAADSERGGQWQAGKWSFRWPLRWNRRCLSQIDSGGLTAVPLSSLQRPSAERSVNYKTDTFAVVDYMLEKVCVPKGNT